MTSQTITFIIPGVPISKARHRSTRQGVMYSPQTGEEAAWQWMIREQLNKISASGFEPLEGALTLRMAALFKRPKSHFGTGRNADKLKPSAPLHCDSIVKDCDNIVKFALDAMNAIVYLDDKQIVKITDTEKVWCEIGEQPCTIIEISEYRPLGGVEWYRQILNEAK